MKVTHESPTSKYFSLAVQQLLNAEGHGAQADLARRAKVSPSYLNDLIGGRKKYWPDAVKERIAAVLGYSVAEMLEIGEHYDRDKVFWPHARRVSDTAAKSVERMARIFQLAARDVGLSSEDIVFTLQTVKIIFPQVAEEFMAGSLTDARLYDKMLIFMSSVRNVK